MLAEMFGYRLHDFNVFVQNMRLEPATKTGTETKMEFYKERNTDAQCCVHL